MVDSIDIGSLAPPSVHPWVAEGERRIRFGLDLSPQPEDWSEFFEVVQRAEAEGFDSYWCYDHPRSPNECWTTLSALAARTTTIRLVSAMSCIYYRPPYMLARAAADVDRLSRGRLILGLGVGDVREEFEDIGLMYPPAEVRHNGLIETLAILRGLWSGKQFELPR